MKIDGINYRVIENLDFIWSRGQFGKVVMTTNGARVILKSQNSNIWKFAQTAVICKKIYRPVGG